MRRVSALMRRQDAHSLYLSFAALLLALTLLIDVLFHSDAVSPLITGSLMLLCLAGACSAFALGRRVPHWIGILSVLVFIVAQSYFLSLEHDPQSAISSVQQFPLLAFYLGWFVRGRVALPLMVLCLLAFGATMSRNPLFGAEGRVGVPVAVHALLVLFLCFGLGIYLRRRQARTTAIDPLTGAYQRQALVERVEQRLRRRSLGRDPFCLVLIDFDDFKCLNDTRGHAAGDTALFETAEAWRAEIRDGDVIGRVGGDEFALLLPHVRADEARGIIDRLKTSSPYPWSAGIAESEVGDTSASMLERADRALYLEKQAKPGRRRASGHE